MAQQTISPAKELRPAYTKYQLAYRLTNFHNPAARMVASVDGYWPSMKRKIVDSLVFYNIPIPYWLED